MFGNEKLVLADLEVWYAEGPEQKGIGVVKTANSYVKLLLHQFLNQSIIAVKIGFCVSYIKVCMVVLF